MPDYERMYGTLFRTVTQVIEQLKQAQRDAEELYIQTADAPVINIDKGGQKPNQNDQKRS